MPAPPLSRDLGRRLAARAQDVLPGSLQDEMGYTIYLAQRGDKYVSAKPLKGLGWGVLEVVSDHRGDTFRSVYTVRFADRVFVLHAFQKKSKSGVATPKADIELIKLLLKHAVEISSKKELDGWRGRTPSSGAATSSRTSDTRVQPKRSQRQNLLERLRGSLPSGA